VTIRRWPDSRAGVLVLVDHRKPGSFGGFLRNVIVSSTPSDEAARG
jgi:hypothetical protein